MFLSLCNRRWRGVHGKYKSRAMGKAMSLVFLLVLL
jgi:hypothetical protein